MIVLVGFHLCLGLLDLSKVVGNFMPLRTTALKALCSMIMFAYTVRMTPYSIVPSWESSFLAYLTTEALRADYYKH